MYLKAQREEGASEQSSALAQRSQPKIHFEHDDMDYCQAWVLGREVFGACDRQESVATAAGISDGDPAGWDPKLVGDSYTGPQLKRMCKLIGYDKRAS